MAASPHWGTNPAGIISAAKLKAMQNLTTNNPKLTALEKAFWIKYTEPHITHEKLSRLQKSSKCGSVDW